MATLYPQQLDPADYRPPSNAPDARRTTQREIRMADYLYEFTGSEAAGDILRLSLGGGQFPKGTEVLGNLSAVMVETDCATTFTLDVGDLDTAAADAAYPNGDAYAVAHIASDADRYADGLNVGAVGYDAFAGGVALAIPHVLQEDCYLTATIATLVTPVAGGRLRIQLYYALP